MDNEDVMSLCVVSLMATGVLWAGMYGIVLLDNPPPYSELRNTERVVLAPVVITDHTLHYGVTVGDLTDEALDLIRKACKP
jgi:hypothetical protein